MSKRKPMSKREKNLKTVKKLVDKLQRDGIPLLNAITDKTMEQHAHSEKALNKFKGFVKASKQVHNAKQKKVEKIFGITDKYKADIVKHGGQRSWEAHVNQTKSFNQLLQYGSFDTKELESKSYEELLSIERQYKQTAKTGISKSKTGKEFVSDYFIRAEEENDLFLNTYFQHLQGVPKAIEKLEEIKQFSNSDLGLIKQIQGLLDSANFKGMEYMEKGRSGYTDSDIFELSMNRLDRLHDMVKVAKMYKTDKNEKFSLIAKEVSESGGEENNFFALSDNYDETDLHQEVIYKHMELAQKQSKKKRKRK